MIVFAASDKGGTGRSVTSANLAYRRALTGDDVCYLDFDFGSPTAAAVFDMPGALRGVEGGGLHSYLQGRTTEPVRTDVWAETEHEVLRHRPAGSGNLVLLPGDRSGGEFTVGPDTLRRCVDLLLRLNGEFDLVVVDLSAGRSYAVDLALEATSRREMRSVPARWLVYHRWTRQHVIAAAGLVFGERGIVAGGVTRGHDKALLTGAIRFVRAAVPDPESPLWSQVPPAQSAWMRKCDQDLDVLAADLDIGYTRLLGSVPLEPVLQWREQLITDEDVLASRIANMETLQALEELSRKLTDDESWGQP
ncbi:ParA family protein [Streptomyces sp. WAC 00631]|uniref:SCO2523 family variant P-loop protein n=1 Tax=unclassified Streptomyces TaxID=2593676 RepID=UPI000F7A2C10|nr:MULTISPECIES: SCO2523 family variant P-loop protein [unclassified Streptomyces]MCC5034588.1 ParA family protein [Streptomyces sp. WAC 00631]MCC9742039.1 SCO2523 family variant P-loop protein [Streptomyces sp. MNU89]